MDQLLPILIRHCLNTQLGHSSVKNQVSKIVRALKKSQCSMRRVKMRWYKGRHIKRRAKKKIYNKSNMLAERTGLSAYGHRVLFILTYGLK
jgi:hypothetical protein